MWSINFTGPLSPSFKHLYIVLSVDYVFKWVEVVATLTNDARVMVKFIHKNITRFGVLRAIISDDRFDFCNRVFDALIEKYVMKHKRLYHTTPNSMGKPRSIIVK